MLRLGSTISVGHSLNRKSARFSESINYMNSGELKNNVTVTRNELELPVLRNVHHRNAGYFSDSSLQILIACGNDVTFML